MKNNKWIDKKIVLLLAMPLLWLFHSCQSAGEMVDSETLPRGRVRAGVSVHDPSIIEAEGKYYIFGSHMETAVSDDLIHWKQKFTGVSKYNKMFDNLFTNDLQAFQYVGRNDEGGYSVWAPDVIYNPVMNKYMLYFCTTSSYIKSNICFALSDSVEGPYHYQDTIIYSGFTRKTVGETNVEEITGEENYRKYLKISRFDNSHWPNAIDPALFFDREDRLWMTYGSWSGGMFILEIDKETGNPIHPENNDAENLDQYYGKHLIGGLHNSIEGPYIIYDKISSYYYLFVSYGSLVSEGGYQIRLYRSENPDGPYTDKSGDHPDFTTIDHSQNGVKLMGNYTFPTLPMAYMAPGHNSAMINENDEIFLIHHTRFDDGNEYHEPRTRRLFRTEDGWLTAAPFAYDKKETRKIDLSNKEIAGYYYLVNHGTDISSAIHNPELFLFQLNGKIQSYEGIYTGTWNNSDGEMKIRLGNNMFSGVIITQHDEAGNPVMAMTALSDTNESIWAVKYIE